MSNFISRLLKGTAGITLNNSFECQSFVEVNPTVNRRSTDSQIQRQYSVSTRLFRLAALVALLFIANIGDVWGGNKVLTIGAGETLYFDFTAMGTPDKTSVCWRDATNTADDKLPADGNGAGTVIAVYYDTAQDMYDDQAIAKTEKANWATITVKARSAGQNMLKFNSDGTSFEWTTARTFTTGEKIYFKDASGNMSNLSNSLWKVNTLDTYPAHIYAYFMGRTDGGANAWSEAMTCVTGTWDVANAVYEFVVPDDGSGNNKTWTKVLITRGVAASFDNSQTKNQTRDLVLEQGYNLFYIWNSKCSDNKFRCGVGRYGYPAALVGEFNGWNAYANTFNNGSTNISLSVGDNQQFKILVGESFLGNTGTFTSSDKEWVFDNENNCKISVSTAGTYYFNYYYDGNASKYKVTVIYPNLAAKKILTKNKYIYFNASSASTDADGWRKEDFNTRFWFKYYDSGIDQSSADCSKSSALENWVYYTQVPDNDYIGRIQLNRIDPGNSSTVWCTAERAYAYERTNGDENCLTTESDHEGWCNSWRPQWTYYCPPMSSATITHNSTNTVTYGGDGGENTPYLVAAGSNIYVSAGSTSALADNNMTPYYQFKKEGANDGGESDSNTHTYTASNTNNTKEAMTVVARNKYSSTYGTASDASSAIYYEARTPYTISYNKGTNGTGTRGSEIKVDGVSFTLPSTAIFTRTGYTQTGWTKTDGGTQTHALGAGYTDNVAQEFFPVWTANNYTVTLDNKEADAGHEGTESVNVTFDATTGLTSAITKPSKEHYDFGGYYVSNDAGVTLTETQLIDANGNWNKNVSGYTGSSGDNSTWVYANDITLYAKWTEHEYTVTIAVTGSGSTSPANSTTAKYVTESGNITATPSAGWHFRDWAFTKTDDKDDIWCASGYGSTNATIHIKAQHDGTLTAHFDPTNYVVRLEDKGADAGHKGTPNVSVTYSTTTNLTSAIDCPQKRYYDFGGYWISTDGGTTLTTQLINTDGTWKHNVSGYTGESGDYATWACAGDTTLYAKWTEHAYTVTASVSPAGAGSVNTVTDAHLTIPSSTITATPINAAWVFDHWVCGDSVGISTGDGTNVVTVTAAKNSTITAYFKKRYELIGSYWNDDQEGNGGMPGWNRDGTGDFTINSFETINTDNGVNLSYSCSLNSNKSYKLKIHDKKDGDYGKSSSEAYYTMQADEVTEFGDGDKDVWIHTGGASGIFTFRITKMREDNGKYYPTLSIERPHQVNFGQKYKDIDGQLHPGTTGGTASVTAGEEPLVSGSYVTYNVEVSHDESEATGYHFAGWWSSDEFNGTRFSNVHPMSYAVTSDDNAYALFTEDSTHVHFANDGHGHVEIGGVTRTDTIVGITTHRTIVAVPNAGYKFSSWVKTGGSDYDLVSTSSSTTTLSGKGGGATSGQTITANFNERWSIKGTMNGEDWEQDHIITYIGRNASSKDTGYVEISLPANTTYQFAIKDLANTDVWYKNGYDKVYYMTYTGNHKNWKFRPDLTHNCGIVTAGAGTYRFIFNITDTTVTVIYPTSYLVNLGVKAYTIEGTIEGDFGGTATATASAVNYPNGSYIANGESVTILATPSTGYDFEGWYTSSTYETSYETNTSKTWTVSESVNAYAKFVEQTNTFEGDVESHETEWNQTGNWSAGHLPTINEVAIIQKPVVVDITDAKAKRVILDQNSHTGSLEIPAGKELIVKETIRKTTDGSTYGATGENDIVIGSDGTNGLGALVMGTHDGTNKATVNFYTLSHGSSGSNASVNQYVGTPFNDETNILYNWYNSWVYGIKYTNNVIGWERVNEGQGMTPFKGYTVISADPEGHSYWQQGTLNATTDQTISGLNWHSGVGAANPNNENLLANSWMAPIKIAAMQSSDFVNTDATVYIFNSGSPADYDNNKGSNIGSGAAQYSTYSIGTAGDNIIPAMQSFSVYTNASGGSSVTLDYSKIVYDPAVAGTVPAANRAPQRRTSAEEANKLRFFVSAESGYGDMVYMWEHPNFAEGFENGWDGRKVFGEAVAPQLFAVTPDGNMAVNCVPDFEGTLLGFQAGTSANSYTFTFEYSDDAEKLYLRDIDNNTYTRVLTGNSYPFTTSDRTSHNRFVLTKNAPQSPTDITETGDKLPVTGARKFIKDDMLYIFKDGKLYNATGMLVE